MTEAFQSGGLRDFQEEIRLRGRAKRRTARHGPDPLHAGTEPQRLLVLGRGSWTGLRVSYCSEKHMNYSTVSNFRRTTPGTLGSGSAERTIDAMHATVARRQGDPPAAYHFGESSTEEDLRILDAKVTAPNEFHDGSLGV